MATGKMKAGATGCIFYMMALVMEIIIGILMWVAPTAISTTTIVGFTAVVTYTTLGLVLAILASVVGMLGLLLIFLGALGLKNKYQNVLPLVAGIMGMVAGVMLLITGIATGIWGITGIGAIVALVSVVLLGVFWILLGVSFILIRGKTGRAGSTLAVGILGIIAGALYCSIILPGFLIPQFLLIPTLILAAMLFLKGDSGGEVKVAEVKEVKVKEAKKLVVRPAEEKKPGLTPEEIEEGVFKYVKKHPEGLDVAECAKKLGVSDKDVDKAVKALVKKGKLAMG